MKNLLIAIVVAAAALLSGLAGTASAQPLGSPNNPARALWDRPLISLTWQDIPAEVKPYFLNELQTAARQNREFLFRNRWLDLYKNIKDLTPQEQEYWMERWWVVARMQARQYASRAAGDMGADEDELLELFEEGATKAGSDIVTARSSKGIATRASNHLDSLIFPPMLDARYKHNIDRFKK